MEVPFPGRVSVSLAEPVRKVTVLESFPGEAVVALSVMLMWEPVGSDIVAKLLVC